MKKEYLLLNTVTNAFRAREVLQKNGFQAFMTRLPKEVTGFGCGYCVYVNRDTSRAADILRNAGIKIYGIIPSER